MTGRHHDLLGSFARHRVAANLLMALMIMAGAWALAKLNTQFFPNLAQNVITVRISWTGASAEDVETAITVPLEQELRNIDHLHRFTSSSIEGIAALSLEFEEGADMQAALERTNSAVSRVRNLPVDAEDPIITHVVRYDTIARVLLTTDGSLDELRRTAQQMKNALLARGIAKVDITGLPDEEIAIQIGAAALQELDLSFDELAQQIGAASRDLPAGSIGRDELTRQLRGLQQQREVRGFEALQLSIGEDGRLMRLGDIATIERRPRSGQVMLSYFGKPAVELRVQRAESADSLRSARTMERWIEDTRLRLPPTVQIHVFDQSWQLIEERIRLLLTNGGGGLALIVAILFLFLNSRVALWVTVGIPVSFMAALAVLYFAGGSINMISLFGLIMALGIIVDDAIVVGEDALSQHRAGKMPLEAAEGGARHMLAPVVSSSLTTVAAFLPMMLIGGTMGAMLFDIPLVVIAVIVASLIESFFILPGHLRHSFERTGQAPPGRLRARLDRGFEHLRDRLFRRAVGFALSHRSATASTAAALLLISIGLVIGGRINFTFFPNIEGTIIHANASFAAGTPRETVDDFLGHLEQSLHATEQALGGGLLVAVVARHGSGIFVGGTAEQSGDQHGSMIVELVSPDRRSVRNREFIDAWRERVVLPAGIDAFTLFERMGGHVGRDIDIRLTGESPVALKQAALELAEVLREIPGVSAIEDDLPWGQDQLLYELTPLGLSLGLDASAVGRQLRDAFDGRLIQVFQDGEDEIEVRALLPEHERNRLATLERLSIALPGGEHVPLSNVVSLSMRKGFEVLRHADGRLAVHVSAFVDAQVNNANKILTDLTRDVLPQLVTKYGVQTSLEGQAAEQAETLGDMERGTILALLMIYLVLAWVFASYTLPLLVMMAIPFGLIGALLGHYIMGIDLTILSLFGLLGLSGIVVNDSIILVSFYQQLREEGMAAREAIVEAACQRLRAVLLTSLTTIGGLLPLLFETSLQAQFLIPMATAISFGLAFSTVLVLIFVPVLLSLREHVIYGAAQDAALREEMEGLR